MVSVEDLFTTRVKGLPLGAIILLAINRDEAAWTIWWSVGHCTPIKLGRLKKNQTRRFTRVRTKVLVNTKISP